jgi:hypothetical protein
MRLPLKSARLRTLVLGQHQENEVQECEATALRKGANLGLRSVPGKTTIHTAHNVWWQGSSMARPMERYPDKEPVPAHFLFHPQCPAPKIAFPAVFLRT